MTKLLVANWKLNPQSEKEAISLAKATDASGVVICPPFPFLRAVHETITKAKLGAQDVFWEERGAYTGEISPMILKTLGVRYVIIGHSERRRWLGETDEMINKKVRASLSGGLQVILCVGEPLVVRRKGLTAAKKFVKTQLARDLKNVTGYMLHATRLIIAYEPVWAIGTGRADKPEETVEMAQHIREILNPKSYILNSRVLYGGSVTSKNVLSFLQYREIGGALVGGASLNAKEFRKIIHIVAGYPVTT